MINKLLIMNCQKISLNDLEDLIVNKNNNNIDFSIVKKNIKIYKNIICSLMTYYKENYMNKDFKKQFNLLFNRLGRRNDIILKKIYAIYVYKSMVQSNEIDNIPGFWHCIQKRAVRNISGVNSFAILLPPYPVDKDFNGCKHNCYYCPNQTIANGADVDIARSYILKEPAVQRGFKNGWDAIKQMNDRMRSLIIQGLDVDKLELIIEGGTYTEYPMNFLKKFHRDIFYAANTYFNINKREPFDLKSEMYINRTTQIRIIGICIETRPDAIDNKWIRFFRETGTTRIQLGVQHTNDRILKKINRGHTFKDSCNAVKLLKNNCFKVDIHLMPDLPLSNPEMDKQMFNIIFNTDIICPDQVKIYPCEVTPFTVIKQWYDKGKYVPYSDTNPRELIDVIKYGLKICPEWVRVPRIVRDIPMEYIMGGNKYCNLRQMINDELYKENIKIKEIRSREIGRNPGYNFNNRIYKYKKYKASNSTEYFISCESYDGNALYGFLRLRIPPKNNKPVFNCLKKKGLIRELHVYNWLVCVGNNGSNNTTQHRGIGKNLLKIAEWISWFHSLNGVVVISGEGVKPYYNKRGYIDDDTFVCKTFNIKLMEFIKVTIFVTIIYTLYWIIN